MNSLLIAITLLPLIGSLIILFVPGSAKSQIKGIALLATLLSLAGALALLGGFDAAGKMQFQVIKDWIQIPAAFEQNRMPVPLRIGFDLGIDGLSLPFVLLTALVSFLSVLASWRVDYRTKEYFFWFLLLVTGLFGVFVSLDLFLFFLFLELTLIPMYFLIGIWGGENKRKVATKFLIYRGFASVGILVSFLGMAYAAGYTSGSMSFNMLQIADAFKQAGEMIPGDYRMWVFAVLFLAILIEEAFFPFHTWLPDAHEQSSSAVSMILGGVLMKVGAYVLFRIGVGVLPDMIAAFGTAIAVLGVINIVYGAMVALVQKDWRRLLAFSTISHMGIVLLAVASMTSAGLQGAVFMTISSGLLSALLFFLVGAIQHRTGTARIDAMGGISKQLPVLSGFLLAGALGSLGLPGMSGFVSEIVSFMGAFQKFPILSAIGTLGIILAAVYLLWAMQRTTFGPPGMVLEGAQDATAAEYVPMVLLLAIVILIGVYPAILGDIMNPTLTQLVAKIGG
ncbi:complex I subunit 4 family protein [Effusibacillus lacus]|uniref:NADH:ubiquinone oxidoreductase subunit M n=1 Tax=Effusibacillus lacus TaxID=1348429 RepID=A0A292YL34_9BACL|nr:NADH-quinone oxidoreductase subunit M [Effusibacillus lacus]TCS71812.1 NADH dehydrogenase subunit M [Effusibacillus lacus]GAX89621.1 NADH:ubiquinone oxidoreductase subunit M [Effusibacillus lacus]